MLAQLPEKKMHQIRWLLVVGWLVLIFSLFYDPISSILTAPNNLSSPFRLSSEVFTAQGCVKVQEECLTEHPYAMGARIWWTMIVPASIFIIFVFGHEFWRRICPLSFISQFPIALGLQRKRKVVNPVTGKVYYKPVVVGENSWLGRNHLYLQFGLLFLGLVGRIVFTNSDRIILGLFLILTIFSAIIVGYLYGGKSWCNYFCPMAPVQMLYTGPRGLFGTQAHQEPKSRITQSMCRIVDNNGQEKSACVGCKSPCIDIDGEQTYWEELKKPGRRLVQYGYLGIVFAFYFYYFVYAGNWDYYFSGAWTHEENQLETIFAPGFYLFEQPIPIPKLIAVFLTFAFFVAMSYLLCFGLEKAYRAYRKQCNKPVSSEQAQHVMFTICTVFSFWIFFSFGARPNLNLLPMPALMGFNALVVLVSSMWLYRTLGRNREQYNRERLASSLRRQLKKLNLNFSQFLEGRSLKELNPDELYILAKVLPGATQQERRRVYVAVVRETLAEDVVNVRDSTKVFKTLRQALGFNEKEHYTVLNQLLSEEDFENSGIVESRAEKTQRRKGTRTEQRRKGVLDGV